MMMLDILFNGGGEGLNLLYEGKPGFSEILKISSISHFLFL